ncbi:MAG: hypothetical protein FIB01_06765 [Gemmatimonadetes bacterium]|nr:hypothetical protein [Gemmatimonadota bacterium]
MYVARTGTPPWYVAPANRSACAGVPVSVSENGASSSRNPWRSPAFQVTYSRPAAHGPAPARS